MKRIALFTVAAWTVLTLATALPASAQCAAPPEPVVFVGRAAAVNGTAVSFRVERVVSAPTEPDLASGDVVAVDHGDEAGLIEVGRTYRVTTGGPRDDWTSHVVTPTRELGSSEGPCDANLTVFADGTPIATGWFGGHDIGLLALVAFATMALLIAVVEITKATRRRRLERRRRG